MARLVCAGFSFPGSARSSKSPGVSASFLFRLLTFAALAVAYGCTTAPSGDGRAPAGRLSALDAPRFGSAAISASIPAPETPSTEISEAGTAAPETASLPDNETAIVPVVQAMPDGGAALAPQPVAKPKKPDAPSESDLQAARGHRPEELIGLKPSEVTEILGHPSLVRHDVPAQVWQYRNRDCVLDLYLYPPAGAGKTRGAKQTISESERTVVYYELRGTNAKRLAGDRCFISIIAARGGQQG